MRKMLFPLLTVAAAAAALMAPTLVPGLTGVKKQPLKTPPVEQLAEAFPGDSRRVLESSPQLTLYSLYPGEYQESDGKEEWFHKYAVLGKTQVTDARRKAELVAALYDGMAGAQGIGMCFNPRHGIRVTHEKKTVDLVICFECSQIKVYSGKKQGLAKVSGSVQPTFDRVLSEAGVAVAKGKP